MDKKKLLAIGISSGIIGFAWTFGSFMLGLSTVAGFIAWSSFFAAGGGGMNGVKKALIANCSGTCWGIATSFMATPLIPLIGETGAISATNGLGACGIILLSKFSIVSFIPAAFLGWSAFIASDMNFPITIISLVCGSFAGFASEKLTDVILKIMKYESQQEMVIDKAV